MKTKYYYIFLLVLLVVLLLALVLLVLFVWREPIEPIEGFDNGSVWSADLIKRFKAFPVSGNLSALKTFGFSSFNAYENTVNDNVNQIDIERLQKQTTPEEVEAFLKNGYWYWPEELKQEFLDKIWTNTMIKIDPQFALNYAMALYNQRAATELLAWNSKEGQFLLRGIDLGVSDKNDEVQRIHGGIHDTIQCSNGSGSGANGSGSNGSHMEKKEFVGMNAWNGFTRQSDTQGRLSALGKDFKTTRLEPEDIPQEVPGFSFVKSPCNPCAVFDGDGDYSCPFQLKVKGDAQPSVSYAWRQLWGL